MIPTYLPPDCSGVGSSAKGLLHGSSFTFWSSFSSFTWIDQTKNHVFLQEGKGGMISVSLLSKRGGCYAVHITDEDPPTSQPSRLPIQTIIKREDKKNKTGCYAPAFSGLNI